MTEGPIWRPSYHGTHWLRESTSTDNNESMIPNFAKQHIFNRDSWYLQSFRENATGLPQSFISLGVKPPNSGYPSLSCYSLLVRNPRVERWRCHLGMVQLRILGSTDWPFLIPSLTYLRWTSICSNRLGDGWIPFHPSEAANIMISAQIWMERCIDLCHGENLGTLLCVCGGMAIHEQRFTEYQLWTVANVGYGYLYGSSIEDPEKPWIFVASPSKNQFLPKRILHFSTFRTQKRGTVPNTKPYFPLHRPCRW